MSDLITIPRSEWQSIKQVINNLSATLTNADIIGMDEACEILDISRKTLQNKISDGSIKPYARATNGAHVFKKSELIKS